MNEASWGLLILGLIALYAITRWIHWEGVALDYEDAMAQEPTNVAPTTDAAEQKPMSREERIGKIQTEICNIILGTVSYALNVEFNKDNPQIVDEESDTIVNVTINKDTSLFVYIDWITRTADFQYVRYDGEKEKTKNKISFKFGARTINIRRLALRLRKVSR